MLGLDKGVKNGGLSMAEQLNNGNQEDHNEASSLLRLA